MKLRGEFGSFPVKGKGCDRRWTEVEARFIARTVFAGA